MMLKLVSFEIEKKNTVKHPYIINNVYDNQLIAVIYIMTQKPVEIKYKSQELGDRRDPVGVQEEKSSVKGAGRLITSLWTNNRKMKKILKTESDLMGHPGSSCSARLSKEHPQPDAALSARWKLICVL